jgi:hypothetical protein
MSQAQKMLGSVGVERLSSFALGVAPLNPAILDKVDWDQTVDELAEMLGVPSVMVRPDDAVDAVRATRAKQQAQQQQAAQMQQAAATAKDLGSTPMDGESPNALTEMLKGVGAR